MHGPIYISHDRGETWLDVSQEWHVPVDDGLDRNIAYANAQLLEFDDYLWALLEYTIVCSPDNGRTWEFVLPQHGSLWFSTAWVAHNNRLYVAAEEYGGKTAYFAQYEDGLSHPLVQGLPPHPKDDPYANLLPARVSDIDHALIRTLASHRGRIFAGLDRRGVWVFDERSETWIPAGLDGLTVTSLVSHQSDLYAVTDEGIYRAAIRSVLPHDKTLTTWGAIKRPWPFLKGR